MLHVWGTGEVHREFWWGRPDIRRPLERPKARLGDNIKINFQKMGWRHGVDLYGSG
jgi:hypothetical protein